MPAGTKDGQLFSLMPYLESGWNVVNLEPRLQGVTLAPATLQNTWCALRWVIHNAAMYGFDPTKIVISGASSGSWFAVTAAMTPPTQRAGYEEIWLIGPSQFETGIDTYRQSPERTKAAQ